MSKSLRVNVAIATFALVLFGLVGMASGRLDVHGGLGWDGEMYARMVTGRLSDGTANTAVRPLVILAVRIPYRFGVDVLRSFAMVTECDGEPPYTLRFTGWYEDHAVKGADGRWRFRQRIVRLWDGAVLSLFPGKGQWIARKRPDSLIIKR